MFKKNEVYFRIPNVVDFYTKGNGVVELDPEIALTIKLLNSKGYRTVASCAGHVVIVKGKKFYDSGYILLSKLPKTPLPQGIYAELASDGRGYCIRWNFSSEEDLKQIHNELKRYAKSL